MSTRITHQADGTARVQTQQNTANSIIDLRKQPAHTPKQAEPAKPDCCGQPPVPARQKNAREYLAGRSPGMNIFRFVTRSHPSGRSASSSPQRGATAI